MSLGLLTRALSGWRRVFGIADQGLVWVALCLWACRVGGAVQWGLLLGVSRGWRCAMGIAAGRVAGAALSHSWACRVGGAVSWGLLTRTSSGWRCVFGIADQGGAVSLDC